MLKPQDMVSSRRNVLRAAAAGAMIASGRIVQGAVTTTPTETEGPFWVDEKLLRSDIRTDKDTGAVQLGIPLYLTISASVLANGVASPLPNAHIDIWHCNYTGVYSDASGSGNPNTVGLDYLRGYQISNSRGLVYFTTIYPGWYVSRSVHIHCRLRTYSGTTTTRNMTTQFFFDDTVSDQVYTYAPYSSHTGTRTRNATDMVYNTVSTGSTVATPDGSRLMLRQGQNGSISAVASFNIVVA